MNEFVHIIKGTPLYVWAILCYLLFVGIKSIKANVAEDNLLEGYEMVANIYHQQILLNNKTFVLRFVTPPSWKVDEENALDLGLDLLLVDSQNMNDASMFISLLAMQSSNKKTNTKTAIDDIQQMFESSGYTKDDFLSSLKLYDGRDFLVMLQKNQEYEYNRRELFLVFEEAPNVVLRLGFQINNLDDAYFDKNIIIFTRLIESMRVVELDVDDKTKADYTKDVVHKTFPKTGVKGR